MATDSPVYNRLQSVFYRLPFMYDLWATATATDRNSGQPDRKSGCLRSIFRSGPVQFPVYMTGLSNTIKNPLHLGCIFNGNSFTSFQSGAEYWAVMRHVTHIEHPTFVT